MTDDAALVHVAECHVPVTHAAMVHWWEELTFIHWRFDAAEVQRLLPRGLTVETFDGSAWVALVPFFLRVGLPVLPSVPWLSRFPETNVRTYARSADGTSGVWFFSLDAARLGAVVTAREPFDPAELTELDHYLTARWALFSAHRRGLHQARAFHDPWPLHHARFIDLDDTLVVAAGLSAPQGTPLVHYAPSVIVRIGWPSKVPHGG